MAHDLIEYLRSRQHKEKPHISVLGFPLRRFLGSLLKQEGLLSRSVRRVSEGEEEEDIAVETDVLYSRPGWWIMGVKVDRVELERADESAEIRIKWSFCIRVAPPRCIRTAPLPMQVQVDHTGCYRRVLVSIRYRPLTEQAYVEILISDPDTGRPCGPLIHQQVSNARRGVVVALPSGAESYKILKHLTDDEWREFRRLEIQSVINELKVRHRVGWTPSRLASSDFVHRFCVTLSVERENKDVYKIETLLMNLGGIFRDPADNGRLIEQPYLYVFDNEGYRWAVGYLMEVEGTVELDGLKAACAWTPCGLMRLTPINSMAEIRDDGHRIEIRDWLIAQEEVMPVKEGSSPYGLLIKLADELWSGNRLARAVAEALSYALGNLGIARLRTFQEESCRKILRRLVAGQHDAAVVITSRTAGGKTLAFFLPPIFYAAIEKGRGRRGVQVSALYTTKALANDQLDEM
ncbi:hypothetical protein DRN94_004440, partial [archaeon]|nr:hypothetical protein [archaeon]